MNRDYEYEIVNGPSRADLIFAATLGNNERRPSITFRTKTKKSLFQDSPITEKTIEPYIRLIGREDGSGTKFILELGVDGNIFQGYYDTERRTGHLEPGNLNH